MKRCRQCREPFQPKRSTLETCCSVECSIAYVRSSPHRLQADLKRARTAERREERARLKSRRQWLAEAQAAFNAMIRERDFGLPCISCGALHVNNIQGGVWDCGHYRTVGAAPELRFEPANAAKQCKLCNSGVIRSRTRVVVAHDPERYATIRARYRIGLIGRIGLAKVEWLEGPHEPKKHTIAELQEIIRDCRARTRDLRAARTRSLQRAKLAATVDSPR